MRAGGGRLHGGCRLYRLSRDLADDVLVIAAHLPRGLVLVLVLVVLEVE